MLKSECLLRRFLPPFLSERAPERAREGHRDTDRDERNTETETDRQSESERGDQRPFPLGLCREKHRQERVFRIERALQVATESCIEEKAS